MKGILILAFLYSYTLSFVDTNYENVRPPGTVKIVDNFFFDEGEITNIDWKEYLNSLCEAYGKESSIYKEAKPHKDVWTKNGVNNKPFEETYFDHPSYDYYPVVGISHEQARLFCIWRTERVKEMLKEYDVVHRDFEYRLPTQTEWELVARAGHNKKQKKLLRKFEKKKNYEGALKICNMIFGQKSEVSMIAPNRSYLPNKYGIYNLYGNVAEMVAEPNVAVGGSFLHNFEEIVPSNKKLAYDRPERWLGFRSVCEFKDK